MKNWAQQAQEQNRAWASPTGTGCLIGKAPQICHHINAPPPLPAPPGMPKHPRWVYTTLLPPKYEISCPQSPPTASAPPDHCFWHCLHVFTSAPNPCSTSLPYYTSPPSHPAPSASQPPYLPNQKTLLLILTSPGTMAILCFFGW